MKISDAKMSLFTVYRYIELYCQKIVKFFWVGRLRVDQTSK